MVATSTALLIGSVVGAAGSMAAAAMNKPKIPGAPKGPDTLSADKMDTMAQDRQDRARKQALASYGRSDTLLTGSSGLGDMGGGNGGQSAGKTLLGQ
jgi:hypothetical protein